MKIKLSWNKLFEPYKHYCDERYPLSSELERLLKDDFKQIEGCICLKCLAPKGRSAPDGDWSNSTVDRTEFEIMYNDIHIDNYSSHARNFDHIYLKEGISFAFALADKLIVMQKPFYIYVLYNGFDGYKEAFEAVFGDANQIVDCNVRFHEKRPNETWGVDDLEESKLEATLLISIQEG